MAVAQYLQLLSVGCRLNIETKNFKFHMVGGSLFVESTNFIG